MLAENLHRFESDFNVVAQACNNDFTLFLPFDKLPTNETVTSCMRPWQPTRGTTWAFVDTFCSNAAVLREHVVRCCTIKAQKPF